MKIAINERYGDLDVIKIIDGESPKFSANELLIKVC